MRTMILAQEAPSATTETTLYTCPTVRGARIDSIFVCNRSAAAVTFRVSIDAAGGGTANKDYLYYDVSVNANDTFLCSTPIWINQTDVVKVYASTGDLSFTLTGEELPIWRLQA